MIVVSDASPLVGLAAIGRFELLRELYGEIFIPPTVFKELTQKGRGRPGDREVREAAWVIEKACTDQELFRTLRTRLDPGEAEAITLAIDLKAQRLIMDEREGRAVAQQFGLKIVGLLGILAEAKNQNLISSIVQEMDALLEYGFRIHPKLYQEVRLLCNE